MILSRDREMAVVLINEAVTSGAALYKACRELGITERTYQRWTDLKNSIHIDCSV
ncbi:MAG: putative transposase [Motiliproteus sp.]|jgi:putative transposase